MTGLNVSLSFLLVTCGLCEAARRAARALLPAGTYISFAQEAASAFQLVACGLEMRALADVGPWAAGVGPDLLLTLLFLLFLLHGATLDGALGNPAVALQELLLAEASLPSTLLKLVAQGLGMMAARALTLRCWAWELSQLHLLQSLMAAHCSSSLRTSVPHGALLEAAGAFIFHLGLLYLRCSLPARRVPALALLATFTTHTGEPDVPHRGSTPGCVLFSLAWWAASWGSWSSLSPLQRTQSQAPSRADPGPNSQAPPASGPCGPQLLPERRLGIAAAGMQNQLHTEYQGHRGPSGGRNLVGVGLGSQGATGPGCLAPAPDKADAGSRKLGARAEGPFWSG